MQEKLPVLFGKYIENIKFETYYKRKSNEKYMKKDKTRKDSRANLKRRKYHGHINIRDPEGDVIRAAGWQ
ncbi:MAG: hypothetical protein ACLU80_06070 [Dorea sp.]